MCLITKKPIKIATKDIVVYKVLNENMVSLHFNFTYKLGKTYSAAIKEVREEESWVATDEFAVKSIINLYNKNKQKHQYIFSIYSQEEKLIRAGFKCYGKGLHSFSIKKRINEYDGDWDIVVKCIIPKGSKYIIAEDNTVISNKLFIQNIIKK